MTILTIDIGGTAIKSALYTRTGKLLRDLPSVATAVRGDDNDILAQVLALVASVREEIAGVAIASAGVIDPATGRVLYAGETIPNYTGTPLAESVRATYGLPCHVENDVNAAALGEYWQGAAQKSASTLCVTIGTGVGGALLVGGKLWHGHNFAAGEMGYIPSAGGANLQQNASTTALLQQYAARTGENVDGRDFFARVRAGENAATETLHHFITVLAQGLLPALYLFAPQVVVIGGGIAAQQDILTPLITEALRTQIEAPRFLPQKICCATLGNRAGMLGALRHFLDCES